MLQARWVNFLKVSTCSVSCPKYYNGGRKKRPRCEDESLQPEGQLEEDLMAAHSTVCLCCHLIDAEAIGIHTSFHILSFQEKKKKNELHMPQRPRKGEKTGEQV